jgi:hypothetical protein
MDSSDEEYEEVESSDDYFPENEWNNTRIWKWKAGKYTLLFIFNALITVSTSIERYLKEIF